MFVLRRGRYIYKNDQHDAPLDPNFTGAGRVLTNSIPDERGRQSLIATYAHDVTQPQWALGYRFDIVLCGRGMTPFENL